MKGGGGLAFRESVVRCLREYAGFVGRASRAEFWGWVVSLVGIWVVLVLAFGVFVIVLESLTGGFQIGWIWDVVLNGAGFVGLPLGLLSITPTLAVTSRRLHDTGRSRWMQTIWWGVPPLLWVLWGFVAWQLTIGELLSTNPSPIPYFVVSGLALGTSAAMGAWAIRALTRPGDPFDNQYGQPP